jgi:hypothetical protein
MLAAPSGGDGTRRRGKRSRSVEELSRQAGLSRNTVRVALRVEVHAEVPVGLSGDQGSIRSTSRSSSCYAGPAAAERDKERPDFSQIVIDDRRPAIKPQRLDQLPDSTSASVSPPNRRPRAFWGDCRDYMETNVEPGWRFANRLDFQLRLDVWFASRTRGRTRRALPARRSPG